MFFKSDSCRLLDDPTGPAARRCAHYDAFLDHNHRALRHLAELELLDRGAGLATLASIRRRVNDLVGEVSGLVESIGALAGERYPDLPRAFDRIAAELNLLTARRREPISGPLTLPFTTLSIEHLPIAGAKAVNLARIRNQPGLPAPDGFVDTISARPRISNGPKTTRAMWFFCKPDPLGSPMMPPNPVGRMFPA